MSRKLGLPFALVGDDDLRARHAAQLTRRAQDVLGRACVVLDAPVPGEAAAEDPSAALEQAGALLTGHLRGATAPMTQVTAVCALVEETQDLVAELHQHEMAARMHRIAGCELVLSRLREVPTTEGLVERVCDELVRTCGFGRVLLSRVQDGVWRPWKLSEADPTVDWFEQWSDSAIPLDTLTRETSLLSERRPELVSDVSEPGVHHIVRTGLSNSYVVAPIVPAGEVIGFFHADHHPTARRCDTADRDLLGTFAESFGHLYTRAALTERLSAQRDNVRSTLANVDRRLQALTDSEIELASLAEAGATVARNPYAALPSMSTIPEDLTAREREVLRLLVSGASNQTIADALHITVATTKSHVKHILSKLGASNRSQVIARFHGVDAGSRFES